MRNLSKKAKTIIAGAAIAGLASTGVAYAYWTTTGTGTGSAATGTDTAVVVYQTSVVTALAPGSGTQVLSGDFTNTNTAPVKVTQVNVAFDAATTWQTGCSSADYTLGQPDPQTGLIPVSAAGPTHVGSWSGGTILLKNTGSNQDGCKGQAIVLAYTTTTASGA